MGAHRSPATVFRKISISIPPVRAGGEGRGRSRETREGEGRWKKGGTSGGQRSLLDPSPPFLSDLAAPSPSPSPFPPPPPQRPVVPRRARSWPAFVDVFIFSICPKTDN